MPTRLTTRIACLVCWLLGVGCFFASLLFAWYDLDHDQFDDYYTQVWALMGAAIIGSGLFLLYLIATPVLAALALAASAATRQRSAIRYAVAAVAIPLAAVAASTLRASYAMFAVSTTWVRVTITRDVGNPNASNAFTTPQGVVLMLGAGGLLVAATVVAVAGSSPTRLALIGLAVPLAMVESLLLTRPWWLLPDQHLVVLAVPRPYVHATFDPGIWALPALLALTTAIAVLSPDADRSRRRLSDGVRLLQDRREPWRAVRAAGRQRRGASRLCRLWRRRGRFVAVRVADDADTCGRSERDCDGDTWLRGTRDHSARDVHREVEHHVGHPVPGDLGPGVDGGQPAEDMGQDHRHGDRTIRTDRRGHRADQLLGDQLHAQDR